MTIIERQVLLTLCYSAVFKYPLSVRQLANRLISAKKINQNKILLAVEKLLLQGLIARKNNILYITRHEDDLLRLEKISGFQTQKWEEAKKAVEVISRIPGVVGIAITGSLAVNNADQDSDIDFMIITQPQMLWLARVGVIFESWRRGKRRSFAHEEKNSWCFNLWLTTSSLQLDDKQRSLYTAFEVCQAEWLWQQGRVEEKFLLVNRWANQYVCRYYDAKIKKLSRQTLQLKNKKARQTTSLNQLGCKIIYFINFILFVLQYIYMFPHKTKEIVTLQKAFFHPRSTRKYIMTQLELELRNIKNNY